MKSQIRIHIKVMRTRNADKGTVETTYNDERRKHGLLDISEPWTEYYEHDNLKKNWLNTWLPSLNVYMLCSSLLLYTK